MRRGGGGDSGGGDSGAQGLESMGVFGQLIAAIEAEGAGALVSLVRASGSSPREAGARMVVRPSGSFHGTIGGGALEWQALARARVCLAHGRGPAVRRSVPLGPALGQCCGGRVDWLIETFDERDKPELALLAEAETLGSFDARARLDAEGRLHRTICAVGEGRAAGAIREDADGAMQESFVDDRTPVYLFGAGHVGRALVLALAPLPFAIRWIDPRPDAFPSRAPPNARMVAAPDPVAELGEAPDDACIVVMTHSHPLDLDIVMTALAARRFRFVGLIGSQTKRARFVSRMRAAGLAEATLDRLTCPIGVPGIEGKAPAVIAASVAAQLLMLRPTASEE